MNLVKWSCMIPIYFVIGEWILGSSKLKIFHNLKVNFYHDYNIFLHSAGKVIQKIVVALDAVETGNSKKFIEILKCL